MLTLEDAVRKMTSLPAQILGLADRGIRKDVEQARADQRQRGHRAEDAVEDVLS